MHPFSDQSGLGFFDASTTIVTTVKISEVLFKEFMSGDLKYSKLNSEQQSLYETVISSLLNQGFIEKRLVH